MSFIDIENSAVKETSDVKKVEFLDESRAVIKFFSHSRKSAYPYAFHLNEDGKSVTTQPMASGSYLSANAPRFFAETLNKLLKK